MIYKRFIEVFILYAIILAETAEYYCACILLDILAHNKILYLEMREHGKFYSN